MGERRLSLYSSVISSAEEDPVLVGLLSRATDQEVKAVTHALRSAYLAGQDESDQRTGKLMARIFGGFVGVTPGIDVDGVEEQSPRKRLLGIVRLLSSAASRKK